MELSRMGRLALTTAVIFVLAGCGGAGTTVPVGATTQSRAHKMAGSWMEPGTSSGDLLYATGGCGGTCVISYPSGELVGSLTHGDAGTCSDTSGNVYIPDGSELFEYPHGGNTPITTFLVSYGLIAGCSVDPITDDVAVSVGATNQYNVAIFTPGSGSPTTYVVNLDAQFCGYDNVGNLFVDGYGSAGTDFLLYELPKGSSGFKEIKIRKLPTIAPGQVQWDGNSVTIEGLGIVSGATIYRLTLSGSRATITGKTTFKRVTRTAQQSWIEGNQIFIPYGTRGHGAQRRKVGVWGYPEGGKLQLNIANSATSNFQGVTLSPAAGSTHGGGKVIPFHASEQN
jgi:hypothetical protein